MKKCPNCDKTYDDAMRFCQADGTPLVDDAPAFDPYATIVAPAVPSAPAEQAEPAPSEPTAPGPIEPDEVLEMPSSDPMKTMVASEAEMREALSAADISEEPDLEMPPLEPPPPPRFDEPVIPPPPIAQANDVLHVTEPPQASPVEMPNEVIAEPVSFEAPTPSLLSDDLEAATVIQPVPPVTAAPPPSPFAAPDPPPSPFAETAPAADAAASPFGSSALPPPPPMEMAPIEAAPMAASPTDQAYGGAYGGGMPPAPAGQNQTLAIVSLISGIVGLLFCGGLTGPVAIITGVMARRRAAKDPQQYGGETLALVGIILGILASLVLLLVLAYFVFVFLLVGVSALS